jgi:hypothetical protein
MHGTALTKHKELEVKLEIAPESLHALNKFPLLRRVNEAPRRTAEVSVYFDTDSHKLRTLSPSVKPGGKCVDEQWKTCGSRQHFTRRGIC